MGMTFSIYVNPKHEGVPYHQLDAEQQHSLDEILDEPKEIFYCGKDWDVLKFFKDVAHPISEHNDESQVYLYIDVDNVKKVEQKIKEKIDLLLSSVDLYDSETYVEHGDLHLWTKLYKIMRTFPNDYDTNKWYLLIDAGW